MRRLQMLLRQGKVRDRTAKFYNKPLISLVAKLFLRKDRMPCSQLKAHLSRFKPTSSHRSLQDLHPLRHTCSFLLRFPSTLFLPRQYNMRPHQLSFLTLHLHLPQYLHSSLHRQRRVKSLSLQTKAPLCRHLPRLHLHQRTRRLPLLR